MFLLQPKPTTQGLRPRGLLTPLPGLQLPQRSSDREKLLASGRAQLQLSQIKSTEATGFKLMPDSNSPGWIKFPGSNIKKT